VRRWGVAGGTSRIGDTCPLIVGELERTIELPRKSVIFTHQLTSKTADGATTYPSLSVHGDRARAPPRPRLGRMPAPTDASMGIFQFAARSNRAAVMGQRDRGVEQVLVASASNVAKRRLRRRCQLCDAHHALARRRVNTDSRVTSNTRPTPVPRSASTMQNGKRAQAGR